jgi:hypothetical protein
VALRPNANHFSSLPENIFLLVRAYLIFRNVDEVRNW